MSNKPLITTVRCEVLGSHCHVTVWSRGGNAGMLVVGSDDGVALAKRLIPCGSERLDEVTGTYRRWALAQATVQREGYALTATQDDDDPDRVIIALDGEDMGASRWEGDRFSGFPIRATNVEIENREAEEALAFQYAAALKQIAELEAWS